MHIGHLALSATDVERSASFLSDILGLRRTYEENGAVSLSCNEKHHEIELLPGDRAGIDHLGLEVEDERDLDALRDALIASGAQILSETPQEHGLRQAIRAVSPMGLVLELYTGMEREPLSVEHYMPPLARRFGHVTFAVTERKDMERVGFSPQINESSVPRAFPIDAAVVKLPLRALEFLHRMLVAQMP